MLLSFYRPTGSTPFNNRFGSILILLPMEWNWSNCIEGVTLQEVREKTEAYYTVKPNIVQTLKSEK